MNEENLRLRVQTADYYSRLEFIIREKLNDGRIAFAEPIIMKPDRPCYEGHPPTFSLSPIAGQFLMDDLWNCGIRPTEAKDGNEVIAAIKAHLEDVRGEVRYHRIKESPLMEVLVTAQRNMVEAMKPPKVISKDDVNL